MTMDPFQIDDYEDEEEDFLREVAAAEAEAASAKCLGFAPQPPLPKVEGVYTAALRGSRSELWQQNQLNLKSQGHTVKVMPTATATVAAGYYGSEASDQEIAEKNCPCGKGFCLILTSNTQKNPGRKFYKCPVREENGGCGFFGWCDADKSSGANACALSYGNANEGKFPELQCPCNAGLCRILTAKTGQNIGQQFYRCPTFEGSCGFFKWCNDQTVTFTTQYDFNKSSVPVDFDNKSFSNARPGSACFKCGKEGHWARDCSISLDHSQSLSKSESGRSSSSAGDCLKCGKGHWARDCPISSDPSQSLPTSGSGKSSSSAGDCFKCGKGGHWARDCPISSDHLQSLSRSGRGMSSSSAGDCFKCGKLGHWARDCSSGDSMNTPFKRQRQY